jgi:hypothetical protein
MFSKAELSKVKKIVYKNLELCCDEAHAHSADCFIGTNQSKLLAKLIEHVENVNYKQEAAIKVLEGR